MNMTSMDHYINEEIMRMNTNLNESINFSELDLEELLGHNEMISEYDNNNQTDEIMINDDDEQVIQYNDNDDDVIFIGAIQHECNIDDEVICIGETQHKYNPNNSDDDDYDVICIAEIQHAYVNATPFTKSVFYYTFIH